MVERATLFVSLEQQYQNLDNYTSWTWAVTLALKGKFEIACICEPFLVVSIF